MILIILVSERQADHRKVRPIEDRHAGIDRSVFADCLDKGRRVRKDLHLSALRKQVNETGKVCTLTSWRRRRKRRLPEQARVFVAHILPRQRNCQMCAAARPRQPIVVWNPPATRNRYVSCCNTDWWTEKGRIKRYIFCR